MTNSAKKLSCGTFATRTQAVAKVAYFALFESHLRFGIAIWGAAASSALERSLIQQKQAVRCLAGLKS